MREELQLRWIADPRDATSRVTACAMCGSDLHIYNGVIPEMERGDVIGHETMGEVVEVGRKNTKLKVGDPDADTDAPRPNGADDPMPSALRH